MKSWKRVRVCLVCGESRCKENEWMVYCFRYGRAFNKKNFQEKSGVGVLRDIVPEQGLGQSPKKKNGNLFFDENFFEH